jgi:hypothetical protein
VLRKERDDVEAMRAAADALLALRKEIADRADTEQSLVVELDKACGERDAAYAVQVEAWAKYEAERARAATAERCAERMRDLVDWPYGPETLPWDACPEPGGHDG